MIERRYWEEGGSLFGLTGEDNLADSGAEAREEGVERLLLFRTG
jgi:hypothetical protein